MAIPSTGKVSIGDIRTELQNTGSDSFSLKLSGRPTTGAPGTFQSPVYTPLNLSSTRVPNSFSPYAVSEWREYNHSENLACSEEDFIIFMNDSSSAGNARALWRYYFTTNTVVQLESESSGTGEDIAMTKSNLFAINDGGGALDISSITLSPWSYPISNDIVSYGSDNFSIFAKNDTTILGYTIIGPEYPIDFENGVVYGVYDTYLPYVYPSSEVTIFTFSTNDTNVWLCGEIYWESSTDKYFIPYATSAFIDFRAIVYFVPPFYVGRFSSSGTLEASVPTDYEIKGLFTVGDSLYGVKKSSRDIYLLDFTGLTSSYSKTAPNISTNIRAVTQYNSSSKISIVTPQLGTFYTYYRVAISGSPGYTSAVTVRGTGTTNHFCKVFLSYPFNNVGQVTATAWQTLSFFSSTSQVVTRLMQNYSEVLYFVLYESAE